MLYTLVSLLFKLFSLIAAGYILARRGLFGDNDKRSVTMLLMHLVLYFTILASSQQEFTPEMGRFLILSAVFSLLFFALCIPLMLLLGGRLYKDEKKKRVFVTSVSFANISFIGYPVLLELCGKPGLLCAVVFTMAFNMFFYSWGLVYLGGSFSLKSLLTNKMMIVSIITLAMYLLQIRIGEPLLSVVNSLSNMATPLSMLLVGYSLASSGILAVLRDKTIYPISLLRMLVLPGIVFLIMRLLGADAELTRICTIITALPVGAMTSIVSSEKDCAPAFAANAMVQSSMLLVLTLPLWVFITGI